MQSRLRVEIRRVFVRLAHVPGEARALWKDGFKVMADKVQRMPLLERWYAAGRGTVEQCSG